MFFSRQYKIGAVPILFLNIKEIKDATQVVMDLLGEYTNAPRNELPIDPILYSYLHGRFDSMQRQHYVHLYGSDKPKRIDFRYGGSNPVVMEFAVRPPTGGAQLTAKQNLTELRKLCRVTRNEAKLRSLLLIDLYWKPQDKEKLKMAYDLEHAGPGKFERHPVRVIYVHKQETFDFSWSPYKG